MNAAQWPASGKNIGNNGYLSTKYISPKFDRIPHNRHVVANRSYHSQGPLQQRLPLKFEEGLIRAHARTLSSRQHEPGARCLADSHMEKHRAKLAIHESNLFRSLNPAEDGDVALVGGSTRHHGAKTHGCSYARTLFTRVFLAAPRGKWGVLPGLFGVRYSLPI